jgi:hypothetical protein
VLMRAIGTFEVKLTPQVLNDVASNEINDTPAPALSRMLIDKQFHGELQAVSQGQMLAARTEIPGSAGYVALERVGGRLHERSGTFVLQHNGTMTRGVPQLTIAVVPDSGTGELLGLAGAMTIKIDDGKHSYQFEYTLPESTA